MARFSTLVSHRGPFPADFAQQPAPDPALFGMPAEDDGSRTDPLLGLTLVGSIGHEPDFDALRDITAFSERKRPEEVVEYLNGLFGFMN
jgi:hypothetical protein